MTSPFPKVRPDHADRFRAAVPLLPFEIEQPIGVCDRLLVMIRSEIMGRFRPPFDPQAILGAA